MKLIDLLKKMGINLDDNIELKDEVTDSSTSNLKGGSDNKDKDEKGNKSNNNLTINITDSKTDSKKDKKEDAIDNKQEDIEMDYKTIKFDTNTGLFDLGNIDNADLKAVLKLANDTVIGTANKVKIDSAFNEKLAGLKIRKGITPDAVKALIKMDNVKVGSDGTVVGLDEAFETLQKEQSGLFVSRNTSESTPVLEGYNPADNKDAGSNNVTDMELLALSQQLKSE